MGNDYSESFGRGEDLCDVASVEELEASARAIVEGGEIDLGYIHGFLSELGQWAGAYPPEEKEKHEEVLAIIRLLEDFIQ